MDIVLDVGQHKMTSVSAKKNDFGSMDSSYFIGVLCHCPHRVSSACNYLKISTQCHLLRIGDSSLRERTKGGF